MTDYLQKAAEALDQAMRTSEELLVAEKRAQLTLAIAREYAKLAAIEKGMTQEQVEPWNEVEAR